MRRRKTPAANNPNIKNIQLLIDAELLEICGGWENVIASFYIYISKISVKNDGMLEAFCKFRVIFTDWLNNRSFCDTIGDSKSFRTNWLEYLKKYISLSRPLSSNDITNNW